MSGVLPFPCTAENSPHLKGQVRCIQCDHEWAAVTPVGDPMTDLECPNCHADTGMKQGVVNQDGEHWACNCGCFYFAITRDEIYCVNCGTVQSF